MVKLTTVNIISGFLGAGKTTLIKKMLKEVYADEQVVLIENEFGEIGVDAGFLKDAGIEIKEMNSGCICCSLSGDFTKALHQVLEQFHPDRIIIEPSGVGKLSDVKRAVQHVADDIQLGSSCTVVDVMKCVMYQKNFGEFFDNQITYADALILSRTQHASVQQMEESMSVLRKLNADAPIVTTPWEQLTGSDLQQAMENTGSLSKELLEEEHVCEVCGHVHDHEHHHHDEECECHHDHHHEHHHHHDHDADEVFTSWGKETLRVYTKEQLEKIVEELIHGDRYGQVLRAKGMVQGTNAWYYFDIAGEESEIREGTPTYAGRYCVIGSKLNEEALETLFEGEKIQKEEEVSYQIEVE